MAESYLVVKGSAEKLPVMFSSFPDGDIHCIVENIKKCEGASVLLFHRLYPNQNSRLIQLFLTLDVLKQHGAKNISVFIPYLPYSRQDKEYIPGEAISADAICRLLSSTGCKDLYTLDCHFMDGEGVEVHGGLNVHSISVGNQLIEAYKNLVGHDEFDVIGPDIGSSYLTTSHGGKNMKKSRGGYKNLSADRSDSYRDIESLVDDHIEHSHDNVLIIDDMISTGSTIIKAIENLRAKGIKTISCATIHGFFLRGSYATLSDQTDHLLYSDSIEQPNAVVKVEDVFQEQIIPMWEKDN